MLPIDIKPSNPVTLEIGSINTLDLRDHPAHPPILPSGEILHSEESPATIIISSTQLQAGTLSLALAEVPVGAQLHAVNPDGDVKSFEFANRTGWTTIGDGDRVTLLKLAKALGRVVIPSELASRRGDELAAEIKATLASEDKRFQALLMPEREASKGILQLSDPATRAINSGLYLARARYRDLLFGGEVDESHRRLVDRILIASADPETDFRRTIDEMLRSDPNTRYALRTAGTIVCGERHPPDLSTRSYMHDDVMYRLGRIIQLQQGGYQRQDKGESLQNQALALEALHFNIGLNLERVFYLGMSGFDQPSRQESLLADFDRMLSVVRGLANDPESAESRKEAMQLLTELSEIIPGLEEPAQEKESDERESLILVRNSYRELQVLLDKLVSRERD